MANKIKTAKAISPKYETLDPQLDQVVIRRDDKHSSTTGGLWLPEIARDDQDRGTILAIGPGYWDHFGNFIKTEFKPGDRVTFSMHGGYPLRLNGEELVMFREHDLLGQLTT